MPRVLEGFWNPNLSLPSTEGWISLEQTEPNLSPGHGRAPHELLLAHGTAPSTRLRVQCRHQQRRAAQLLWRGLQWELWECPCSMRSMLCSNVSACSHSVCWTPALQHYEELSAQLMCQHFARQGDIALLLQTWGWWALLGGDRECPQPPGMLKLIQRALVLHANAEFC